MDNLDKYIKNLEDTLEEKRKHSITDDFYHDTWMDMYNMAIAMQLPKVILLLKEMKQTLDSYAMLPDGAYYGPKDEYANLGKQAKEIITILNEAVEKQID